MNTQEAKFFNAALGLAALGWKVFPLVPKTKRPLTPNGFHDATTDPAQIRDWWTQTPEANIGVAAGRESGLTILDVDVKHDGVGAQTLAAAIAANGGALPETVRQSTWSGGTHYIFKYAPDAAHGVGKFGAQLDCVTEGGYIVVAPSVIEQDGVVGVYSWEVSPYDMAPAEKPSWLRTTKPAKRKVRTGTGTTTAVISSVGRNNYLTSLAGTLRRRDQDEATVRAALLAANTAQFADPLEEAEVEKIVSSAMRNMEPATAEELVHDDGGERYTDTVCANLIASGEAGQLVRHADEDKETWLHWDGKRLLREPALCMYKHVQALALKLFIEATATQADADALKERIESEQNVGVKGELSEQYDALLKRVKLLRASAAHLESSWGMASVIKVATGQPRFRVKTGQLDQHPHWLNVQNGTLDLETGALRPHSITDLITKVSGATYDPAAPCPTWKRFLEEIVPDDAVRAFLQRSVGYALSDDVGERCFWVFYGIGRNGKGTFIEAIRRMLGDYAGTAAASVLMAKPNQDDKRNDVAVLRGARFVAASESDDGQRIAEALVKTLAGGNDPLNVRLLYAEYFQFIPTFKIFLATNHKPRITGTDAAIWDRVRLVPFAVRISEAGQDRTLGAKLAAELPGILNWALAGYRAWRTHGLQTPPAVRAATEEYRAEMDVVGNWLADCCDVGPAHQAGADALYQSYRTWALTNGHQAMSARTFGPKMIERGFERLKNSLVVYQGVGIRSGGWRRL